MQTVTTVKYIQQHLLHVVWDLQRQKTLRSKGKWTRHTDIEREDDSVSLWCALWFREGLCLCLCPLIHLTFCGPGFDTLHCLPNLQPSFHSVLWCMCTHIFGHSLPLLSLLFSLWVGVMAISNALSKMDRHCFPSDMFPYVLPIQQPCSRVRVGFLLRCGWEFLTVSPAASCYIVLILPLPAFLSTDCLTVWFQNPRISHRRELESPPSYMSVWVFIGQEMHL